MEFKHAFTMCRLCLCESDGLIGIFQVNEWFGYVAAEVIRDLLQFQVSETDGYPHVVCSVCLGKLTDFKEFKQQCQNSRETYDNVFASSESHPEHPIDIVPSASIKTEPEEEMNDLDATTEDPSAYIKTELEEETDYVDATPEVELGAVKLEPEDPLDTRESHEEIRKRSIAFPSLEHLTRRQNRTCSESHGPFENTRNGGEPLLKRRKDAAVDANPCENMKSSGSAGVKVGKMVIKVGKYCKTPGERLDTLPAEKSDTNRVEPSVIGLRRGGLRRREEVNYVETSVDERESETERGEDAPLGVTDRCERRERFRCNDCGKSFKKKDVLIRHLELHGYVISGKSYGDEGDFKADISINCGSKRETKDSLKEGPTRKTSDKGKKHGVRKYICDSCGKVFNGMYNLRVHLQVHRREKLSACAICGKRFGDESSLRTHKLAHTDENPFTCEICGMQFARNANLITHQRIHTGEKPYSCQTCGKAFSQKSALGRHRRVHSGEKPYRCKICGKKFADSSYLVTHTRVHSREKPYSCEECQKCFSDRSNLRRHLVIHTQERLYLCEVCNKCFSDSSSLRRHSVIHSQEKP